MRTIDINADMGEGYGAWPMGEDAALLDVVSSASIACGFHAGDPDIMAATFALAAAKGVAAGAHPGFADRQHFGRRLLPTSAAEVERMVAYQVGAAAGIAALAGAGLAHVKAHGALYTLADDDAAIARAVARGVRAVDPALRLFALAGGGAARVAETEGLRVVHEVFADRGYEGDGRLRPRGSAGAVLHDAEAVTARARAMLDAGAVPTGAGRWLRVPIDTICVHGDTPGAVTLAVHLRQSLEAGGYRVAAVTRSDG